MPVVLEGGRVGVGTFLFQDQSSRWGPSPALSLAPGGISVPGKSPCPTYSFMNRSRTVMEEAVC